MKELTAGESRRQGNLRLTSRPDLDSRRPIHIYVDGVYFSRHATEAQAMEWLLQWY